MLSLEFLITSFIVVLILGTGVIYTVSIGLVRVRKASVFVPYTLFLDGPEANVYALLRGVVRRSPIHAASEASIYCPGTATRLADGQAENSLLAVSATSLPWKRAPSSSIALG